MSGGAGGGGQQPDNSLGPLWIMVALCVGIALVWTLFHSAIMWAFIQLKLFEIQLISPFTHELDSVQAYLQALQPADVTWRQAHLIAAKIGPYIGIPAALILLSLAYIIFRGSSAKRYNTSYGMMDLVELEKDLWPQIKPALGLHLEKQDLEKGPWAMSLTPMNFAKRKGLIIEEEAPLVEGELRRGKKIIAKLNKGKASALFSLQLGPVWEGVEKLPPYQQVLFGAFAARANGDRQACDDLLKHIANTFDNKKNTADFSGGRALCAKYINTKCVQKVVKNHAYALTVMASMLSLARCDGVFATADFLWLKPMDRRCWFLLNAVGRHTPVAEAAGPFSHWIAEKELGRRVILPMVDNATIALEMALQEIIYHSDKDD